MSDQKRGTFDELVSGISAEERDFLLAKLSQSRDPEMIITPAAREADDSHFLMEKYKSESFLYKFIIWIRSFISKKTPSDLYNDDLIENLARKVNREHPNLIDHKNAVLQSGFYKKLKELKNSADFFKPYFAPLNDNPGRFYVFLSTFLAPEISAKINQEVDPYTIPFDRTATSELRQSLLKRLEEILKNIQSDSRTKLYNVIISINWLKQFSELPYLHFIAQFTSFVSNNYTCPYINAQADLPAFVKILTSANTIPKEAMQAFFLYPYRSILGTKGLDAESENALHTFMTESATTISRLQLFITTVPIKALGKIIFKNYEWTGESFGGGEDWFVKFKKEWRVIFDNRWNSWLRDKKKNQLASVIEKAFKIDSFPEMPERPWEDLWGGIPFNCSLTGGFLSWFTQNKFPNTMTVLNTLLIEGIFINKENRAEFSEAMNMFIEANQSMQVLLDSLKSEGEMGKIFATYIAERKHTVKAQQTIDNTMVNIEDTIRACSRLFCNSTRIIENILHGILSDTKDRDYESIQNLMTIRGRENRKFRSQLAEVQELLKSARSILGEVEPLDCHEKNQIKNEDCKAR